MYIVIISKLHLRSCVDSILMLKPVNNILIELRVPSHLKFTWNIPTKQRFLDSFMANPELQGSKTRTRCVRSDIPGCLADLSWQVADINGKLGNQVWNIGLSN